MPDFCFRAKRKRVESARGAASGCTVADRLDVVAIRIEHVGAVVVLVVDRARAGRPVIDPACAKRRLVEGVDEVSRVAGEGDVNLGDGRARGLESEERLAVASESGR